MEDRFFKNYHLISTIQIFKNNKLFLMAANKMTIEWANSMPNSGLKPNSIYIINPGAGTLPAVFITDKTGSSSYRINPTSDLVGFIQIVNGLVPDGNGAVQLDLAFSNGTLTLTGSGVNINLDARYVTLSEYNSYKSVTNSRLDSLESIVTSGLKTPVPFNASTTTSFPTQNKGFTYKVTVAGTTSGITLQVNDTIIYDETGNTPFIVQANVDMASTTIAGLVMIATQSEVDAGSDASKVVVSSTLQAKLNTFLTSITASQAEVDAGTINNKFVTPLTLQTKINAALVSVHTHTNKAYLDKIGETGTGEMTYNGNPVFTLGSNDW